MDLKLSDMNNETLLTILTVIYGIVKSMTNPWVFWCLLILIIATYPIFYMLTHKHETKTFIHMLKWGREEEKNRLKKSARPKKITGKSGNRKRKV